MKRLKLQEMLARLDKHLHDRRLREKELKQVLVEMLLRIDELEKIIRRKDK